jgi:predicted transcriptional regulator
MSDVSVHVDQKSCEVLRNLSERTGRTIKDILDQAIEEYRRKVFLEAVNAGYAALRADPVAWAEFEAERRSMQGSLMDGLDPTERWGENGDLLPPDEVQTDG